MRGVAAWYGREVGGWGQEQQQPWKSHQLVTLVWWRGGGWGAGEVGLEAEEATRGCVFGCLLLSHSASVWRKEGGQILVSRQQEEVWR
jgi:hypothetical protein